MLRLPNTTSESFIRFILTSDRYKIFYCLFYPKKKLFITCKVNVRTLRLSNKNKQQSKDKEKSATSMTRIYFSPMSTEKSKETDWLADLAGLIKKIKTVGLCCGYVII